MKQKGLLVLLALFAIATAGAKEAHRVYTIAFDIQLADLHEAAVTGDDRNIPGDRLLLIDAEIGAISIREDTEESFSVEVELVGGAWKGDESIELQRAYVLFRGNEYRELFAKRAARRVQTGEHIIVLGRYEGLVPDYDKHTKVALLEAVELRRL